MAIFRQNNQQFRTLDLFVMVALVGAVTASIGSVVSDVFRDQRPERARSTAEVLARQLEYQHRVSMTSPLSHSDSESDDESASPNTGRMPASDGSESETSDLSVTVLTGGEIGRDPWGRPYRYRVYPGREAGVQHVFVWSDGPNQVPESVETIEKALAETIEQQSELQFKGDDIGYVHNATSAEVGI